MNCYTKVKYLCILFYKVTTSILPTTDNLPDLEDYTVGHREAEQTSDRTEATQQTALFPVEMVVIWPRNPRHNETHKLST